MKQHKDNMEEKNDYDYIVIHTGTNDVGNLSTDEIVKNMENWQTKKQMTGCTNRTLRPNLGPTGGS